MEQKYNIYSLKTFEIKTEDMDKYKYGSDNIIDITNKLKKNKGYCLKINPKEKCIFYGDFDHATEKEFNDFCELLANKIGIKKTEISYTLSKKSNEFSYHFSLPEIEVKNPKYIKKYLEKHFKNKFNNIDLTVYNGWFRLPNQTLSVKPIQHNIINGKMEDFIYNYIENTEYDLDISEFKINKSETKIDDNLTNSSKEKEINNLLLCLSEERFNYDSWLNIGIIIFNETNNIYIWKEWSKKYKNYNESEINKKWNTFSNNKNKLKIGTLHMYAKEDNIEMYNDIFSKIKKIGVWTDLEAAETIYKIYNKFVCCQDILFVFDKSTGMWSNNETIIFKIFTDYSDYLHVLKTDKNGDSEKTKKSYGNTYQLFKNCIHSLKTLCINDEWLIFTAKSSLGYILFKNGIYNMKTSVFTKDFNSDIVFFDRISRDYVDDIDKNYLIDIEKRLFIDVLGEEVSKYLLLNLARAIAGDTMKKIYFGLGGTNGGKSTITNACTLAFEGYMGNFNAETLSKNKSSADPAAQWRWAYLLRYKRIIFSNELKTNVELDGNSIKKVSSGVDKITARTHNKGEEEFIPSFKVFCFANDLPKIDPFDDAVNIRLNIIGYKKCFVDNPSNEFQLKIDYNLDKEMNTDKFKNTFVKLIFERYYKFIKDNELEIIPEEIKNSKTDWVGDATETNIINTFLYDYEITNNVNDYIKSADINFWLGEKNLGITFKKFTTELKQYCTIKKLFNVIGKDKKINGKCLRVWVGIKKIVETNNEHEDDDTINPLDKI